jgi:ribonuclease BN (tRNA processing enzyme)
MHLTILGTGCPLPDKNRAQSGYLLEKSGKMILVDGGAGTLARLNSLSIDWSRLDTFLITHHHLDHMSELLPLITARALTGFPEARVYGPEGTQDLFRRLLKLFPYVDERVSVSVQDLAPGGVYSTAGFEVATFAMRHFVTSLAYRFDGKLVICGDSEPVPALKEFARGCRVLIHECSLVDGQEPTVGHTTPTALGQALAGAELDWLLLTHFYPQAAARPEEVVAAVRRHFRGRVSAATDLQQIAL